MIFGRLAALDTLAETNQFQSAEDRYFIIESPTTTYNVSAKSGLTNTSGTMHVDGAVSGNNVSTINYKELTGFVVGSDSKLSISNIKFTNAKSNDSGAVIDAQGKVTLNNVTFYSDLG